MNAKPNANMIAVICIVAAVGLTVFIFAESRNDSGLRMASLVSSTSIAAALIAIASVLLTGRDVSGKTHDPADLPDGSIVQETSTVQTPPIGTAPKQ